VVENVVEVGRGIKERRKRIIGALMQNDVMSEAEYTIGIVRDDYKVRCSVTLEQFRSTGHRNRTESNRRVAIGTQSE
jgi:hypothetical protein